MKNARLLRLLPRVALFVFALSWADALVAQQHPDAFTSTVEQPRLLLDITNQQQTIITVQLPDAKTFSGRILKSGDRLVLQDSIGESTYLLDDQDKAKLFQGKNVKMTGTVDEVTKTIAVVNLKPEL